MARLEHICDLSLLRSWGAKQGKFKINFFFLIRKITSRCLVLGTIIRCTTNMIYSPPVSEAFYMNLFLTYQGTQICKIS